MIYNLALILPCAVCMIGAAWLICKRKSTTRSQKILTVGFLDSAVFFFCTAIYIGTTLDSTTFVWWDVIDSFATLLVIPTMYLYLRSMIHKGGFTWKDYIWFLPAVFVGMSNIVINLLIDKTEFDNYIQTVFIERNETTNYTAPIYVIDQFIGVQIYHLTALFQIIGTSIFAVLGVRKYHQELREFYSDADDKSIYTDTRIVYWFLTAIPLSFALIVPDISFWQENHFLASLLFIAWAVVYFALFYYGSQKRHTADNFFEDLIQADIQNINHSQSVEYDAQEGGVSIKDMAERQISEDVYRRLVAGLTKLIDVDQIFLKKDLRLDELANLMFTNRVYISIVIKKEYHCSFSDFINGKRIDFSMELMRLKPNLTQDNIAEKSGFVSAQSYSRTFKKLIGIPPKEWFYRNVR